MPKYTKKIKIEMTDRVYNEFKSILIGKKMSGNLYGVADEILMKLLEGLKDNKPEISLAYKEEINDPSNKTKDR